jgi:RNA polymerase sigma-70 factor (ECF subfamily)
MLYKDPDDSQNLNHFEDSELVRLAQQGDVNAFAIIYERHFSPVYNRVRYVVPEREIEDVTQEIFIAVIKSLKSFRYEAQFSTWLRTLTNRTIADFYRRQEREKGQRFVEMDLSEIDPSVTQNPIPKTTTPNFEERVYLRQGLRAIPEHYCEIILMRFAEGLQFSEIAEARGQSLEATKSLFRRAIASLRTQLEDDHD